MSISILIAQANFEWKPQGAHMQTGNFAPKLYTEGGGSGSGSGSGGSGGSGGGVRL
jgi:hypothetical protein